MKNIGNKNYNLIIFILFIIPAIIVILFAFYIPFIMNLFYAFTDWNGIQSKAVFNGIKNFQEIFKEDGGFAYASLFTLKYGIFYILLVNIIALFLANILDKNLKTRNILRAAFFIPYILSLVIVGFVWKFIFKFGFESLGNLTGLGIFRLSWLGDINLSFYSILFVSIWQSVGFYIVIYIAGLQSIPHDVLEASMIDGAGSVNKFFKITLPLLMPSFTSCFFFALISSIRVFDVIVSLTGAGPGRATASITYDIYTEAFANNRYGYGTAKSLILFVVVILIVIIQVRYFKDKEVEI